MKVLRWLLLFAFASDAFAGQAGLHTCPAKLAPLAVVPPKLPYMLHNEYAGEAEITFTVTPSGDVAQTVIASMRLHPIGHAGNAPHGYREALLAAVSKWKYPVQRYACLKQLTIAIDPSAD